MLHIIISLVILYFTVSILKGTYCKNYKWTYNNNGISKYVVIEEGKLDVYLWLVIVIAIVSFIPILNIIFFLAFICFYLYRVYHALEDKEETRLELREKPFPILLIIKFFKLKLFKVKI